MILATETDLDFVEWPECHSRWHETYRRVSLSEPAAMVIPHNRQALSLVVKTAQKTKQRIIPCGSGSKLAWGNVTKDIDWLVSTKKLNRIVEHPVDDLTITVEAGVTLKELQNHLKPYKQFLPIDPAFPKQATLGGIVSTANAGSWRQRYGGIRDLLLGITVVRSDGELATAGGKVVKNVAGYDLMKLFTGSFGSLAIATEFTFRLYPIQESAKTLLVTGSQEKIAAAQQKLLDSVLTPTRADLLSPSLMEALGLGEEFGLLVCFEAIQESITAQVQELEAIAKTLALPVQTQSEEIWGKVQDYLYQMPVYCKFGVLPNQASHFLEQVADLTDNQAIAQVHVASGLGVVGFPHAKFLRQFGECRQLCEKYQGFFTILEAPYSLKTQFEPWGYSGDALPLMRKIKQKFDPNNLFSPGRFVGNI